MTTESISCGCRAFGCKNKSDTAVANENGNWEVCFRHINYFDAWDESLAAPVDWRWINEGRVVFDYLADAGVKVTKSWVKRIGQHGPTDRYTELYLWLLERADNIPPHTNEVLLREFIKLFFRYAEFHINTFAEHFDTLLAHPLFDPVEFMRVYLTCIRNHEAGRRYMAEMLSGPCRCLVYMDSKCMNGDKISNDVKKAYADLREAAKRAWRNDMKNRLQYKEDLIAAAWHPDRVSRWYEAGIDILDL